jgi:hypothetical protein
MSTITLDALKRDNEYFYACNYTRDAAITKDAETFAKRLATLDAEPGMRCGDFLKLKDGTLRRIAYHWGNGVQPSSGTGDNGSFYLGNGYCSYSGGLDPSIPVEKFKVTSEVILGRVWIFHEDSAGAGRGIYARLPFRVYEEI